MDNRFDRHMPLFGAAGQRKIRETRVTVVGAGGLGSHVVQQLAFLGVRDFALVEPDELDETNRNRLIGARHDDQVPGTRKVGIAERLIRSIEPDARIRTVPASLVTDDAYEAVRAADVVFGCFDKEGPRLVLTELCAAYERNYIDLASDVIPGDPAEWGGRVCTSWDGRGCLVCLDELDAQEAGRQLAGPAGDEQRRAIYGVHEAALVGGGPSVVSVNGMIASLAVTEFMAAVTGLRNPVPLLRFRGWTPAITRRVESAADCYYCRMIRGRQEAADVERYIRDGVGEYL
jgi:molybdopterin/thiamine biosynthesis adenylyltransferase